MEAYSLFSTNSVSPHDAASLAAGSRLSWPAWGGTPTSPPPSTRPPSIASLCPSLERQRPLASPDLIDEDLAIIAQEWLRRALSDTSPSPKVLRTPTNSGASRKGRPTSFAVPSFGLGLASSKSVKLARRNSAPPSPISPKFPAEPSPPTAEKVKHVSRKSVPAFTLAPPPKTTAVPAVKSVTTQTAKPAPAVARAPAVSAKPAPAVKRPAPLPISKERELKHARRASAPASPVFASAPTSALIVPASECSSLLSPSSVGQAHCAPAGQSSFPLSTPAPAPKSAPLLTAAGKTLYTLPTSSISSTPNLGATKRHGYVLGPSARLLMPVPEDDALISPPCPWKREEDPFLKGLMRKGEENEEEGEGEGMDLEVEIVLEQEGMEQDVVVDSPKAEVIHMQEAEEVPELEPPSPENPQLQSEAHAEAAPHPAAEQTLILISEPEDALPHATVIVSPLLFPPPAPSRGQDLGTRPLL